MVARLYAPEARFISHPFRSASSPLDYARSAFTEEDALVECRFGEPITVDDRAAVEYWRFSVLGPPFERSRV